VVRTGLWGRVAVAGLATALVLAVPATAFAATTTTVANPTTNLTVIPYENCITVNANGSTTVQFGYYSFSNGTTTIAKGPNNNVTPASLGTPQPSSFLTSNNPHAFSVTVPKTVAPAAPVIATWTVAGFAATGPNAGAIPCASGDLTIVGWVSCVTLQKDGSTSALYGYYSGANSTVTINKGAQNNIVPARFEGPEPTKFSPGFQQGVFVLGIPKGLSATWTVNGFPATAPNSFAPSCTPALSLPQDGNGLGLIFGLVAAGLAGTFFIRRIIARGSAVS
jgi:hypothetical protein